MFRMTTSQALTVSELLSRPSEMNKYKQVRAGGRLYGGNSKMCQSHLLLYVVHIDNVG